MEENTYVKNLFDVSFLEQYKYISKELFYEYIKIDINKKLLNFINIVNKDKILSQFKGLSDTEKNLLKILKKCYDRSVLVRQNILDIDYMNNIIDDLIYEKIMIQTIDSIILLEEIDYLENYDNIAEKLALAYYYILEIEIYNFYNIEKIIWKDEKQKQYVSNKVNYSSLKQQKIKQELIKNISDSKKNAYEYNKKIGILSTYPLKNIYGKYDNDILLSIYKIKYLLTLDSKLKKCSDNKILEKKNKTMMVESKNFFKELLDKYKKMIEKKDYNISKLEKENNILQQDNEIKKNTIINYANSINEYNNLSWIKKLGKIFKRDNIKLLN